MCFASGVLHTSYADKLNLEQETSEPQVFTSHKEINRIPSKNIENRN